jgi:hypothetical protein
VWREVVASARIARLEADLESGLTSSRDALWPEVGQAGTPLVGPVASDPAAADVTFLLRAEPGSGPWTLCEGISPPASSRFRFSNVPGTDVWHVTLRLPRGTRVTDGFSPDAEPGGARFDWEAHFARRRRDPYNRLTVDYPDQGIVSPWGRSVSLLDLTGRGPHGFTRSQSPARDATAGRGGPDRGWVTLCEVLSLSQGHGVPVYVYLPAGDGVLARPLRSGTPLAVLFDGWELVEIGGIAAVFDELVASARVPPFAAVVPDPREHRAGDLSFSDAYSRFVTEELVAWAGREYGQSPRRATTLVGGASLGGLTALYCGLRRPDVVGSVVSLIGAVGAAREREPYWLARQYPVDFPGRLSAMLEANRHLHRVLRGNGYDVAYREFPGGHDCVWLPNGFGRGLARLMPGD